MGGAAVAGDRGLIELKRWSFGAGRIMQLKGFGIAIRTGKKFARGLTVLGD
jgi:hypothetical protein